MEVKGSRLKIQPSFLENLIFFVEVSRLCLGSEAPPAGLLFNGTLAFFPQTVTLVLWVSSYCAKILRPLKTSLQKKKKKKKETQTALVRFSASNPPCVPRVSVLCNRGAALLQPPVLCGFQELTASLQDLLAQTLEHIKAQEVAVTTLKLANLTLEGNTQVVFATVWKFVLEFQHV